MGPSPSTPAPPWRSRITITAVPTAASACVSRHRLRDELRLHHHLPAHLGLHGASRHAQVQQRRARYVPPPQPPTPTTVFALRPSSPTIPPLPSALPLLAASLQWVSVTRYAFRALMAHEFDHVYFPGKPHLLPCHSLLTSLPHLRRLSLPISSRDDCLVVLAGTRNINLPKPQPPVTAQYLLSSPTLQMGDLNFTEVLHHI